MSTILQAIVRSRSNRLAQEKQAVSQEHLQEKAAHRAPPLEFVSAFEGPGPHIIAEIKKASPSRGVLKDSVDPETLAKAYQDGGANAISVVTEPDYFLGSTSMLEEVRNSSSLPILRKDFITDAYQIVEARAWGADSYLLIAAILDAESLAALIKTGRELNMEPLVEIHDPAELKVALGADARVIGINNRDLRSFKVDLSTTLDLVGLVPKDRIVVSESGIRTRQDVRRLTDAGVKGLLIGESLVTAPDPAVKIRELLGGD